MATFTSQYDIGDRIDFEVFRTETKEEGIVRAVIAVDHGRSDVHGIFYAVELSDGRQYDVEEASFFGEPKKDPLPSIY